VETLSRKARGRRTGQSNPADLINGDAEKIHCNEAGSDWKKADFLTVLINFISGNGGCTECLKKRRQTRRELSVPFF
jgi:hypothetical protein